MVDGFQEQRYFMPIAIAAFFRSTPSSASQRFLQENGFEGKGEHIQSFLDAPLSRDQWRAIVEYEMGLQVFFQFVVEDMQHEAFVEIAPPFNLLPCQDTVVDAMATIQRCFNFHSPISMRFDVGSDHAILSFETGIWGEKIAIHNLLRMVAIGRVICGEVIDETLSITMGTSVPEATARSFVPMIPDGMIFGDQDFIKVSRVDLARPLKAANADRRRVLEQLFVEQCKLLHPVLEITDKASACLKNRLGTGTATLENIASDLGVGTRTLQRRLKETGTCFACVFDKVRFEQYGLLRDTTSYSSGQIAAALGYLDTNSFYRARARWRVQPPE